MIWKKKHLRQETISNTKILDDYISRSISVSTKAISIAIIGGGPKGMYALERLLSELQACEIECEIHWFNEDLFFGCGPNFRTTQPEYLLINFSIGNVNVHTPNHKNSIIREFPGMYQWVRNNCRKNLTVRPTDFASRALTGIYLQNYLTHILQNLPLNISLSLIPVGIYNIKQKSDRRLNFPHFSPTSYSSVLLCTGHCYTNTTPDKTDVHPSCHYLSSPYPIEKLSSLNNQNPIAIMGMGLTFIDVALALTEGKGGSFIEKPDMTYTPCGKEPILYPFSRNNLPMIPRPGTYKDRYQLRYIHRNWIDSLSKKGKIDFVTTVLPVVKKEIQFAYYSTLLKTRDEEFISNYILRLNPEEIFDWEKLLFPSFNKKKYTTYQQFVERYMESMILEAKKSELESPILAAAAVWREASPLINQLYKFNGFTGSSMQLFLQYWHGNFSRVSFGPPIENMKKILALTKARIIRFEFKSVEKINKSRMGIELVSPHKKFLFKTFINARIARSKFSIDNNALYSNLKNQGLAKALFNEKFCVDSIEIGKNGRLIPSVESPHYPQLYAYGTPTEGTVLDNDTLSRKSHDFGSMWAKTIKNQVYEFQNS